MSTSSPIKQNLGHCLHKSRYTVVLVSPLKTHQSRVLVDNCFSKTDPKDALLVADNGMKGYFDIFQRYTP